MADIIERPMDIFATGERQVLALVNDDVGLGVLQRAIPLGIAPRCRALLPDGTSSTHATAAAGLRALVDRMPCAHLLCPPRSERRAPASRALVVRGYFAGAGGGWVEARAHGRGHAAELRLARCPIRGDVVPIAGFIRVSRAELADAWSAHIQDLRRVLIKQPGPYAAHEIDIASLRLAQVPSGCASTRLGDALGLITEARSAGIDMAEGLL